LVGNGRVLPRFEGRSGDGPWALFGPEGTLLAVYEAFRVDQVKPSVVLPTAIGS
jgi:tRNA pseudouridine55 synthase